MESNPKCEVKIEVIDYLPNTTFVSAYFLRTTSRKAKVPAFLVSHVEFIRYMGGVFD